MARSRPILLDTNVVSRLAKGQQKYLDAISHLGAERAVISAVTKMELLRWLFEYKVAGKGQMEAVRRTIEFLPVVHIDRGVSQAAVTLYQHHKQLSMKVPDMLLAATALHLELPLFTTNLKDFRFIRGLELYLAPNLTDNG